MQIQLWPVWRNVLSGRGEEILEVSKLDRGDTVGACGDYVLFRAFLGMKEYEIVRVLLFVDNTPDLSLLIC